MNLELLKTPSVRVRRTCSTGRTRCLEEDLETRLRGLGEPSLPKSNPNWTRTPNIVNNSTLHHFKLYSNYPRKNSETCTVENWAPIRIIFQAVDPGQKPKPLSIPGMGIFVLRTNFDDRITQVTYQTHLVIDPLYSSGLWTSAEVFPVELQSLADRRSFFGLSSLGFLSVKLFSILPEFLTFGPFWTEGTGTASTGDGGRGFGGGDGTGDE